MNPIVNNSHDTEVLIELLVYLLRIDVNTMPATRSETHKQPESKSEARPKSLNPDVTNFPPLAPTQSIPSFNFNDKLITALKDDNVAEALNKTLHSFILLSIDEAVKNTVTKLNSQLGALNQENKRMQTVVEALTAENQSLKKRLEVNENTADEINRLQRSSNLIIRGLEERTYAERTSPTGSEGAPNPTYKSVETAVGEFLTKELKLNITEDDIKCAFRIKKGTKDKVRPVLVSFANLRLRKDVLMSRKALKTNNVPVYISEHLTPKSAELFAKARRCVEAKRLDAAYTRNGMVYIKATATSDATQLHCAQQLPQLPPSLPSSGSHAATSRAQSS